MKLRRLLFFLFLGCSPLLAQVTFVDFPEDGQLFSRNENDEAFVDIAGQVQTSDYQKAEVKLFTDNEFSSSYVIDNVKTGSEIKFQIPIKAQLAEYTFEFWLKNAADSVLVKTTDKVLCGDAFIIYGQSNAVSYANYWVLNDSISKKYTRNYTHYFNNSHSSDGWHDATFPEVGSLGKWFIKDFTEKEKIPILVINASLGGVDLKYLIKRNPDLLHDVHSPYGLMLKRIFDSKVKSIKGFIFLQGESEANTSLDDVNGYEALFDTFRNNLALDAPPIDRYYVYQLGVMNTHALWEAGKLREFKRQLTRVYDDVSVVPATGFGFWHFDGLHYSLEGYGIIAKWLFNSYLAYEKGLKELETADLQKLINQKDVKRLKLVFNQEITVKDSINFGYYTSLMKDHFYAGRASGFINSIEREGKKLYLYYDRLPTNKLTYLPSFFNDPQGKPYGGPFIKNRLGTPALTFYEVEIEDELAKPVVDELVSADNTIQLFINETRAKECEGCQLEISYITNNGLTFLKTISGAELKVDLPKTDFVNLNDSDVLILRYTSSFSESEPVAYSLKGEDILDTDKDGIPDNWDNCNDSRNFEQSDFDNDGIGDTCDSDADGDLIPDSEDNCLLQVNPSQPELLVNGNFISSSIVAKQYHWLVNGSYSETTNDNLYIVRNTADYAVIIADNNGCNSLSSDGLRVRDPNEVLLLGKEEEVGSIVYPIPAESSLNYSLKKNGIEKAQLYSVNGKLVKSYSLKDKDGQFSLNGISEGTYVLVFLDASGNRLITRKIIKRG